VFLLNECLLLLFILLTQFRNFWIHPCVLPRLYVTDVILRFHIMNKYVNCFCSMNLTWITGDAVTGYFSSSYALELSKNAMIWKDKCAQE